MANELLQKKRIANFTAWIDGLFENDKQTYLLMTYDEMFELYNNKCAADGKKFLQIEPSEINFIIRQALYTK